MPGLPAAHIDLSFADIIKHLDGGLMGAAEGRYGRFIFMGDMIYAKISGSAETPGPFFSSAKIETSSFIGTAMAGYRVLDDPGYSLDALAGIRGYAVDTELTLFPGLLAGGTIHDSEAWVDPLIGAKGRVALTDQWYLTGWGFVGGFDVSSKFSWDVFGGVGYAFNKSVSGVVGYRALGVDYENGNFLYDVVQQGPVVGLVARF